MKHNSLEHTKVFYKNNFILNIKYTQEITETVVNRHIANFGFDHAKAPIFPSKCV